MVQKTKVRSHLRRYPGRKKRSKVRAHERTIRRKKKKGA